MAMEAVPAIPNPWLARARRSAKVAAAPPTLGIGGFIFERDDRDGDEEEETRVPEEDIDNADDEEERDVDEDEETDVVNPNPNESNLLTNAANALLSSSNVVLICITPTNDNQKGNRQKTKKLHQPFSPSPTV